MARFAVKRASSCRCSAAIPDVDYDAITQERGRQAHRQGQPGKQPGSAQAAFQEPHGGGQRFKVGFRRLQPACSSGCSKGAPYDAAGQARLRTLTVYPPNWRMVGLGSQVQLVAVGEYNDGSVRDLTSAVALQLEHRRDCLGEAGRAGDGGAERRNGHHGANAGPGRGGSGARREGPAA